MQLQAQLPVLVDRQWFGDAYLQVAARAVLLAMSSFYTLVAVVYLFATVCVRMGAGDAGDRGQRRGIAGLTRFDPLFDPTEKIVQLTTHWQ